VVNSSNEPSWNQYANSDHIYKPTLFNLKWLEQTLLKIVTKEPPVTADGRKGTDTRKLIIVDDADNFNLKVSDVLRSIVVNARHLNCGLILTARELSSIPKILYSQASYSFFARQDSDYNIYYIATIIGYENGAILKNLDRFVFAQWSRRDRTLELVKLKDGGTNATQQNQQTSQPGQVGNQQGAGTQNTVGGQKNTPQRVQNQVRETF
jgi:hypothetical protein